MMKGRQPYARMADPAGGTGGLRGADEMGPAEIRRYDVNEGILRRGSRREKGRRTEGQR